MANLYLEGMTVSDLESLIQQAIRNVLDGTQSKEQLATSKALDGTQLTEQRNISSQTYLSRKEASKLLGISLPTLHKLTRNGTINAYRLGNRVLYKPPDIDAALSQVESLKYNQYGKD
jgi:excisionase family DNA binding protein